MFRTMLFGSDGCIIVFGTTKEVTFDVKTHFKSVLLLDKPAPKLLLPSRAVIERSLTP